MSTHHSDTVRLAAHAFLERVSTSVAPYHEPGTGKLPPGFRVVIFTVSTFGAIGNRRVGRSLPTSLLDDATWATPSFGPFARMCIGLSARRALAHSLRHYWGTYAHAARLRRGGAAVEEDAAVEVDATLEEDAA